MGDNLPLSSARTVFALRSILKKSGRFSLSAVPGRHSPSATHSATAVGTHRNGTDPSYLPAAWAGYGSRQTPTVMKSTAIALRSFIVPPTGTSHLKSGV